MNPISEQTTTTSAIRSSSIQRPLTESDTPHPQSERQSSSPSVTTGSQKWNIIELRLKDIKMALATLKDACAMLEVQTDRLGHDISDMKGIIEPIMAFDTEGSRSAEQTSWENKAQLASAQSYAGSGLITPPTTPGRTATALQRITSSTGRIVHPDLVSTAIYTTPPRPPHGILGKRRSTDADSDMQSSPEYSAEGSARRVKRVRFADINDIPISNLRTPVDELETSSNALILPVPVLDPRLPSLLSRSSPTASNSRNTAVLVPQTSTQLDVVSPISPPISPIILPTGKARKPVRSKFRDSMALVRKYQPRQKTRWDPMVGKRVPIVKDITYSPPSSPTPTAEKDYEKRLSDEFSNATIE